VAGWQFRSAKPLVLVPDTSPKAYKFEQRTKRELEEFFIVKSASEHFSGERPRLLDTAIWWFRFTDLEGRFGNEPTPERLVQTFIEDFNLTDVENSAFFEPEGTSDTFPGLPSADDAEDREEL
jgi:hypothetical protein